MIKIEVMAEIKDMKNDARAYRMRWLAGAQIYRGFEYASHKYQKET
jgi:hypothetical protein